MPTYKIATFCKQISDKLLILTEFPQKAVKFIRTRKESPIAMTGDSFLYAQIAVKPDQVCPQALNGVYFYRQIHRQH